MTEVRAKYQADVEKENLRLQDRREQRAHDAQALNAEAALRINTGLAYEHRHISPAWLAVSAALRERRGAQEKCCSIHANAEARAGYAARIDELRQILPASVRPASALAPQPIGRRPIDGHDDYDRAQEGHSGLIRGFRLGLGSRSHAGRHRMVAQQERPGQQPARQILQSGSPLMTVPALAQSAQRRPGAACWPARSRLGLAGGHDYAATPSRRRMPTPGRRAERFGAGDNDFARDANNFGRQKAMTTQYQGIPGARGASADQSFRSSERPGAPTSG